MVSQSLEASVEQWRAAADSVLAVAESAALLPADSVIGLSLDTDEPSAAAGPTVHAEVGARFDRFLDQSDAVTAQLRADAGDGHNGTADAVPVLLGVMEVSSALMAASQEPEEALSTLGVDASGAPDLGVARRALDEFRAALLGQAVEGTVPQPAELTESLETLETTGTEEILALIGDATVQVAVAHMVDGAVTLGGKTVKDSFDWVKDHISFLKRVAIKGFEWVVNKFRALTPDWFGDWVEKQLGKLLDAVKDKAPDVAANAVGYFAGRRKVDYAWQAKLDAGVNMDDELAMVAAVVKAHVKDIGRVSRGRAVVSAATTFVTVVLSVTIPYVQVVLGALALAVFGFVWYLLVDGYNDVEALAVSAG